MPAGALFLKRRCKSARQQSKQETPPRKPEKNTREQTARTPNKETATRPKNHTERAQPGFRETQKRENAKEKDRENHQNTRKNARDRGALKAGRLTMYGSKGVSLAKNH